jgi:hypothetical protein
MSAQRGGPVRDPALKEAVPGGSSTGVRPDLQTYSSYNAVLALGQVRGPFRRNQPGVRPAGGVSSGVPPSARRCAHRTSTPPASCAARRPGRAEPTRKLPHEARTVGAPFGVPRLT